MNFMKTKMLYAIVVIVILAIVLLGFVYFSPIGNMICGPCGCSGDQCGGGGCTPYTCAKLGRNCGTWSNGCGGTLNCGTCIAPQTCSNGYCCTLKSCAQLGKNCGSWPDGCGGTVTCPSCTPPTTCHSGDCYCLPNCVGKTCGTDGCAGSCGTCTSPQVCYNGNCCTKATCASLGKTCGTWPDGCGTNLNCGSCPPGLTCSGSQCFDGVAFSISLSPAFGSAPVGVRTTLNSRATLTSSSLTPQSISLKTTCPSAIQCISYPSVTPFLQMNDQFGFTLTINTTTSTPAGTYSVTTGGLTRNAIYTLTVS